MALFPHPRPLGHFSALSYTMQLFVRCGAPLGSFALDASPHDTIADLKHQLAGRAPGRLGRAGAMVRGFVRLLRL